ncbi:MAG: flagellar protein FlaG [Lachnospiraceae bacterium]|nr:flagellar protein FlaG [Lachnospiraceae bacterium]
MALEPIGSIMTVQAQTAQKPVTPPTVEKTSAAVEQGNYIDGTTLPVSKIEGRDQSNEQGRSKDQENQQPTTDQVKKAVEQLNKNMSHSEAVFGIHEKTSRITIKIVDKDTKELIKELPPEKTLDMITKVWEIAGLLVDEKL